MDWNCSDCTFANTSSRSNCEICGAHKPASKPSSSEPKPAAKISNPIKKTTSTSSTSSSSTTSASSAAKPSATTNKTVVAPIVKPTSSQMKPLPAKVDVKPVSLGAKTNDLSKIEADNVAFLTGMGISKEKALEGLKLNQNNKDKALDWCLLQATPVKSSASSAGKSTMGKTPMEVEEKQLKFSASEKMPAVTKSGGAVPTAAVGVALGSSGKSLVAATAAVSVSSKPNSLELAKIKAEVEESRKKKEEAEKQQKMAITSSIVAREETAKANAEMLKQKRSEQESKISSVTDAIKSIFQRYGIIQADVTLKLVSQMLLNIINNPDNPKFRTINLKSENFQRNIGRLIGSSSIFRLCGFLESDSDNLVLKVPNVSILQKAIAEIQGYLNNPVTDIYERLGKVQKVSGNDIALYAAIEFRSIIRAISSQPNSVTKHFDFSGPYKAKVLPHASLVDILFGVLHFEESENRKSAKRDSFFTPEELEYLKWIERDISKWLQLHSSSTPIAEALKVYLKENNLEVVSKYVSIFSTAIQNIVQQPENSLFQKIKLENLLKKIGGNITHGEKLFQCFGFEIKSDGTAVLKTPFESSILYSKLEDMISNWEILKPN